MEYASVIGFQWSVAEGGYAWLPDRERGEPVLADQTRIGQPRRVRLYEPLTTEPGLHRVFADLPFDNDAILAFASKYGQLRPESSEGAQRLGVPESEWKDGISRVRTAMRALDAIRSPEPNAIGELVELSERRARVKIPDDPVRARLTIDMVVAFQHDPIWRDIQRGGERSALNLWLLRHINDGLADHVPARLRFERDVFERSGGKRMRPRLWLFPKSLIGAIWLMVAQEYEGSKDIRRCPVCGTWFDVSQAGGRSHKTYCSGACRARASREAKRDAELS